MRNSITRRRMSSSRKCICSTWRRWTRAFSTSSPFCITVSWTSSCKRRYNRSKIACWVFRKQRRRVEVRPQGLIPLWLFLSHQSRHSKAPNRRPRHLVPRTTSPKIVALTLNWTTSSRMITSWRTTTCDLSLTTYPRSRSWRKSSSASTWRKRKFTMSTFSSRSWASFLRKASWPRRASSILMKRWRRQSLK